MFFPDPSNPAINRGGRRQGRPNAIVGLVEYRSGLVRGRLFYLAREGRSNKKPGAGSDDARTTQYFALDARLSILHVQHMAARTHDILRIFYFTPDNESYFYPLHTHMYKQTHAVA